MITIITTSMTICVRGTQTLFELERTSAAAIKGSPELYSPDGRFVVLGADVPIPSVDGTPWTIGGVTMANNLIEGCSVGIRILSSGGVEIGNP